MKLKLSWNEKKSANVYYTGQCIGHCVQKMRHWRILLIATNRIIGFLTDSGVMIVCTKEKPQIN